MHDGVLIGIGTAMNDDPQLNSKAIICEGSSLVVYDMDSETSTGNSKQKIWEPSTDSFGHESTDIG